MVGYLLLCSSVMLCVYVCEYMCVYMCVCVCVCVCVCGKRSEALDCKHVTE